MIIQKGRDVPVARIHHPDDCLASLWGWRRRIRGKGTERIELVEEERRRKGWTMAMWGKKEGWKDGGMGLKQKTERRQRMDGEKESSDGRRQWSNSKKEPQKKKESHWAAKRQTSCLIYHYVICVHPPPPQVSAQAPPPWLCRANRSDRCCCRDSTVILCIIRRVRHFVKEVRQKCWHVPFRSAHSDTDSWLCFIRRLRFCFHALERAYL